MSVTKLLKAGIRISFCSDACVPEIPLVQDVLYALRLVPCGECYDFCISNHMTYIRNVHMVASTVAYDVLSMELYDEDKARRIIAEAIIQLCPDEARCTKYVAAYKQALEVLGRATEHDTVNCLGCNARE